MKNKKKIFLLTIIFLILIIQSLNLYAVDSIIQGADDFLDKGTAIVLDHTSINNTSKYIFSIFSIIGTAVVVVVGTILGIQFISGSVEEKAKIKESLIPFTVGAIIIFGAIMIWTFIIKLLGPIFN